jgi:aspartyl/asparaginyl-tRNA synthetase
VQPLRVELRYSRFSTLEVSNTSGDLTVELILDTAFLAQSPQLAKQMCMAAGFGRVYEVAPVFRAENSNTPRHLTEFMGLDLEMEIQEHYHEVLDVLDGLFLSIFKGLQLKYAKEIEVIKKQFPHDDFVFLDKTLRLTFKEGMELLSQAGATEVDGTPIRTMDDMS